MKRILTVAACLFVFGMTAVAQDDAEFQAWMKAVQTSVGGLRKNLDANAGDAAAADAKKLEEVFKAVHGYWEKKKVEDATKFAMDAGQGFHEVGELAAAGKFDEAKAALKKTMGSCGGCHNAHREKGEDGKWKIK